MKETFTSEQIYALNLYLVDDLVQTPDGKYFEITPVERKLLVKIYQEGLFATVAEDNPNYYSVIKRNLSRKIGEGHVIAVRERGLKLNKKCRLRILHTTGLETRPATEKFVETETSTEIDFN